MTKLIWGAAGERFFEAGVDRGVLYVPGLAGVAWNGLKAVSEAPSGGEPKPYYIDGFKYVNISAAEEFNATLEAFSSPAEFAVCDGSVKLAAGLFVTQQPRKSFGLSYRTLIGNDVSGLENGYKIHLVYNALAASAGRNNNSVSDSVDPMGLSWDISTRPPSAAFGYKPTAHFVIDSTKTDKDLLAVLEAYLYGANGLTPAMPTTTQLIAMFSGWVPLNLAQPISVVGTLGGATATLTNLMPNPSFEAVTAGTTVVRTNLCINPNLDVNSTGWVDTWFGPTSGAGVIDTHSVLAARLSGYGVRKTWTAAPSSAMDTGYRTPTFSVVAGATYAATMYVRASANTRFTSYIDWTTSAGAYITSTFSPDVDAPGNTWVAVSSVNVAPPTAAFGRFTAGAYNGAVRLWQPGDTCDFDSALIEQTDQIRPYFDGNTPDALGFDYGWTGAANASTSTAKAAVTEARRNLCVNPNFETDVLGWTAESGVTLTRETASPISGTGSMKMSTGGDTYTQVAMAIGEVITFSVDYKTVGTVAGAPRLYSAAPGAVTQTTALPLTQSSPGRYSVTSAPAVTAGNIILAVFGPTTGGSIILDNVLIEKSTVAGTYFDGSTPNAGNFINSWTGTANASASVQSGVKIAGTISGWQATTSRGKGLVLRNAAIMYGDNPFIVGVIGQFYALRATITNAGSVQNYVELAIHDGTNFPARFGVTIQPGTTIEINSPAVRATENVNPRWYVYLTNLPYDIILENLVIGLVTGVGLSVPPYFDGDSADFVYRNQVVNPGWSGVAHASTTVTPYLTDLPLTPTPGSSYIVGGNLWVANNGTWTNYGPVPGGLF